MTILPVYATINSSASTFFLQRLEPTFAQAAKPDDLILMLMFPNGDLDQTGSLYVGTEIVGADFDYMLVDQCIRKG